MGKNDFLQHGALRNVPDTTSYKLLPGVQTAKHKTMDKMEKMG